MKSGSMQYEVRQYIDRAGRSPFRRWTQKLDGVSLFRVFAMIARVSSGNFSAAKAVGCGVSELRLDFGPGFRIYFGKDGNTVVILLGGGTKQRRQNDIQAAQTLWPEYKTESGDLGWGWIRLRRAYFVSKNAVAYRIGAFDLLPASGFPTQARRS